MIDFCGLAGPGGPGDPFKMWGAMPPTFWKAGGFLGGDGSDDTRGDGTRKTHRGLGTAKRLARAQRQCVDAPRAYRLATQVTAIHSLASGAAQNPLGMSRPL